MHQSNQSNLYYSFFPSIVPHFKAKSSRSRPDMVEALVRHVRRGGTHWQYHALMRAMALTGQGNLIPGVDTAVYHPEEDQAAARHLDTFHLSQQLLKGR